MRVDASLTRRRRLDKRDRATIPQALQACRASGANSASSWKIPLTVMEIRLSPPAACGTPRDCAEASSAFRCYSLAMVDSALTPIEIGLTAAIVTVEAEEPAILVAGDDAKGEPRAGLPFGPFDPLSHRTFESGLRAWSRRRPG